MNTPLTGAHQNGLTLSPASFTLTSAGATQQLTATANYSDGSTLNVTNSTGTTYTSSNTLVATVNGAGQVKGLTNGTARITATYAGFSATASATVNILKSAQNGVTVSPTTFTMTSVGATDQLAVLATYTDGSTLNVTSNTGTAYTSSNKGVATVSTTGMVKAVAKGTATITASYGGFSASTTATVSTTPAPPGLVAAYNFNEGSGSTVTDLSGNGNTGTISGATWTTSGKFGGALSFNGSNSWVTVNDSASLDLTNGVTLEAWVKPALVSSWQAVVIKEQPSGLSYALYANSDHNSPDGAVHTSVDTNLYGVAALAANTWTHLATSYDGGTLRLYVNGTQVSSQAVSGSLAVSTGPLRIGGDSVWGEYLNGVIDEVRVYNRALTPTEIQTDMNTAR
jgi:hypothetical protein